MWLTKLRISDVRGPVDELWQAGSGLAFPMAAKQEKLAELRQCAALAL
jgi:hypothetical protein